MKYGITYLLGFIIFSFQAQDKGVFKGTLKDASNKELLIGANVFMLGNTQIGASADFDGHFAITVPEGKHRFVVSFVGMVNDTIEVIIYADQITEQIIFLKSVDEVLDEIVVKAGKFDHKVEELTISMEIIQPDLIENKNTRSVESILDQTPGLNILDGEPQIRGGSGFTFGVGSKVAVLVDDMPMLSGDAGRPEWGFVPIENIEQIEVIKGAASVLSGASALSGAIHIKTAEPTLDPLTKINLYSGFYSEFGRLLKEGVYQDFEHKDTLVELIRFKSTTEKDYVKMIEFENNLIKPIEIDLEIENKIELKNFLKSKLYEKH